MNGATVERIRGAFAAAAATHDLGPLRRVMSPGMGWAAVVAGPGNCHSREEVLGIWAAHLADRGGGEVLELTPVGGRLLLVLRADHPHQRRGRPLAHVLSVHGGRITQIQDYPDRAQALAAQSPQVPAPIPARAGEESARPGPGG
ncbi:MAG: hypothetical protein ACREOD_01300 [Candidatus Dormibacteria bacterium]